MRVRRRGASRGAAGFTVQGARVRRGGEVVDKVRTRLR